MEFTVDYEQNGVRQGNSIALWVEQKVDHRQLKLIQRDGDWC